MEARFLLDTNICIYIRRKSPQDVMQRFLKLDPGEAVISVITFGELLYGAEKSVERVVALERLRELVQLLPAMPLPEVAAEAYGTIRADLESKGEKIGNNDLWIAAHAIASELTLVTNNEREFRRVRGLKIQNWARA
jgi:tRNA(fMet)-specific endonuclease VapC